MILRLNNLITYPSCRLASGEAPAPGRRDGAWGVGDKTRVNILSFDEWRKERDTSGHRETTEAGREVKTRPQSGGNGKTRSIICQFRSSVIHSPSRLLTTSSHRLSLSRVLRLFRWPLHLTRTNLNKWKTVTRNWVRWDGNGNGQETRSPSSPAVPPSLKGSVRFGRDDDEAKEEETRPTEPEDFTDNRLLQRIIDH